MKIYEKFELFVQKLNENSIKAGEDSEVYIDDYRLDSGKTIKAAEILGAIKSSSTEKQFKQYFFDEYGEASFSSGELENITKFFNKVKAEEKEDEAEEEDSDDKDSDDLDLDIDI